MKPNQELVLQDSDVRIGVFLHAVQTDEAFSCCTYMSDGLAAHGQAEIVLTIKIDGEHGAEKFHATVLNYHGAVLAQARRGNIVHVGGITSFAGDGFLGFAGIVYGRAQPLDGVPFHPGHLAAIPLRPAEVEAVKAFGHLRVLARLGAEYSYYPFLTWADASRRPLPMDAIFQTSLLARMPRMMASRAACTKTENRVTLHLPPTAHPTLSDALIRGVSRGPVAILTGLHPSADACLVWDPSFGGPRDIGLFGSKRELTSGCFLSMARGQERNFFRLYEDGFAFGLTDDKWSRIASSLQQMDVVVTMDEPGNLELQIKWEHF